MKAIILLIAVLVALSAQAQITILNTDLPHGGNTFIISNGDPTKILVSDLQVTGANQSWDYTLTANSQNHDTAYKMTDVPAIFYLAFLSSDYADRLSPNINLGLISITNNYSFYNLTSSKLEQTGTGSYISGLPFPTFYNPKDEIYILPMNYGNADSSNSHFSASVPTLGSWKEGKKRVNHVDGWGTLKTPLGSKDVLRIRSEVFYNDTLTIDTPVHLSLPPFPRHQVEYKWLAKNGGFPVLEVVTNVVAGNEVVAQVLYQDTLNTSSVQNITTYNDIIVYPQPSDNRITIALNDNEAIETVSIYDLCGRLIKTVPAKNQPIINISTSDIPAGLYPVILQGRNKKYETKISVIH